MDRSLDEIVSERQRGGFRGQRRGGRRNDRNDYPRDGIRKSNRDEPRNLDSEWVHDKFDENSPRRSAQPARRRSPEPIYDSGSAKLRVENLHYDLTEDDLQELFNRIGPVQKLSIQYDRAGRSDGVAYVMYESIQDAKRAVREYDGANANGQPIRLIPVPVGTSSSGRPRNPFDTAVAPSRPLADRITVAPGARSRSLTPIRHTDVSGPVPANIDRYVPGQGDRSRSPMPRRREGRGPGDRRERGDRGDRGDRGGRSGRRPKKTQEELDAEMEDYWSGGAKENGDATSAPAAGAVVDIEMAE